MSSREMVFATTKESLRVKREKLPAIKSGEEESGRGRNYYTRSSAQ